MVIKGNDWQNFSHKNSRVAVYQNLFKTKLGLALGGGGARGIAHVGILRAFEEHQMEFAAISGTSVGALVAALCAFGKKSNDIEKIMSNLSFSRVSSLRPERLGFVNNHRIAKLIEQELGYVRVEEAKIPLAIMCTDLISGQKRIFTEGPLGLLVQASCSFPGLYTPIVFEDMILVDGALTENIPVSAVRALGANFVVAVSLSDQQPHITTPAGVFDVISRSFDILVDHASTYPLKQAEYTIRINLNFMSRFKMVNPEKAIKLAYDSAQLMLSRPLVYWWLKPFFDYAKQVWGNIRQLLQTLIRHPKIKVPFIYSKSFIYRYLSRE